MAAHKTGLQRLAAGRRFWTGLSARLLVLTIFFVMLSEVFVYAPSIGRYRLVYMQERIAAAHLASLAAQAPHEGAVAGPLLRELLDHARSHGVALRREASKALMLSDDMPPRIDVTYDLRQAEFFPLIWEALLVLAREENRVIRVVAPSPKSPGVLVETVIDEAPMREEMFDYSKRILVLSIIISLITASLVYLSLQLLFVRPMLGITQSMTAFRADPDDGRGMIRPSRRSDEIGRAQRELANMQEGLRTALQQRSRLAALGTAVTKINHDLRNILASAQLVSDHIELSADPKVRKSAPTLLGALDRAIKMCSQTLAYAHDGTPAPVHVSFDMRMLAAEVGGDILESQFPDAAFECVVPPGFEVVADRDQIYRVLGNIALNAFQAGARRVAVSARRTDTAALIEIADDGPGLSAKVRENLFRPFSGSGRVGGTGLGLSIARDLMRGHGGGVRLIRTGESGTVFELTLPLEAYASEHRGEHRAIGSGFRPRLDA